MKRIVILGLICFSFYNCSNEHLKKDFIGVWDDQPINLQNNVTFYNDSVVLWSYCRKSVGTWKVNSTHLFLYFPKTQDDPDYNGKSILKYRFNTTKDSLFAITENDSLEHLMLKVKDNWSHHLKNFDIKINIPAAGPLSSPMSIADNKYPNIYVGWKNHKLKVVGSGDHSTKSLITKKDYSMYIIMNLRDSLINQKLYPVTLIVDKEVTENQLDSIKSIIKDLNFKNTYFFKVFTWKDSKLKYGYRNPDCNEEIHWYWHGRFITD